MIELEKILAFVGGITGPLGLGLSYLTYRRDRGQLQLRVKRKLTITNGVIGDRRARNLLARAKASGRDPSLELYVQNPDIVWAMIHVANVGRRKIIIDQIGWIPRSGKGLVLAAGFDKPGWLPLDLDEAGARDFPIADAQLAGYRAVYVRDTLGRAHYGAFERSVAGAVLAILVWLRIPRYR